MKDRETIGYRGSKADSRYSISVRGEESVTAAPRGVTVHYGQGASTIIGGNTL